jgi:aminodeoxyfutalosine synthase
MSNLFQELQEKISNNQRISDADALALFASNDLLAIGTLAAEVNQKKNGDRVYFNVNRHINYTNICVNQCIFCAFAKLEKDDDGYTLALDDIREKAEEAVAAGATEIHSVGGLHPRLPFSFYLDMLRTIKAVSSQLHIKAFTAVEIDYFSKINNHLSVYTFITITNIK